MNIHADNTENIHFPAGQIRTVLIAPDSFKGSLSAKDAAEAIRLGVLDALGKMTESGKTSGAPLSPVCLPIADGGEGTLDALTSAENRITLCVKGPDGAYVRASYGFLPTEKGPGTAVIEMASAAGLTLIPTARRSAGLTTTFGVGQMMRDALSRGFTDLLLTAGGSATNDGGCGLFAALGARFLRADGSEFVPTGLSLSEIDRIDLSGLDPALAGTHLAVATDVKNPLLGAEGATAVYAPQKGATADELAAMERGMENLARKMVEAGGRDVSFCPGCGAGGGIAAPLFSFLPGVRIVSGIDAVLDAVGFDEKLKDAALVITGEGKIDRQSLFGKAIAGVVRRAGERQVPVVCLVGCVGDGLEDPERLASLGTAVKRILALTDIASDPADSMTHAAEYLRRRAADLFADNEDTCAYI